MTDNVSIALISTLASGTFALLGAALSGAQSGRRDRSAFRTEAALASAEVGRAMWKDDWIELNVRLERERASLSIAGCPAGLIDAHEAITMECWRDVAADREAAFPEEHISIDSKLLAASREIRRAITADLLRQRGRRRLRREAIEQVASAIAEHRS